MGSIKETLDEYQQLEVLLPAMGYSAEQLVDLEQSVNSVPCDLVLVATPIDLGRMINIEKPAQRVRYETREIGQPTFADVFAKLV